MDFEPLYQTRLGKAYCADSLKFMQAMRAKQADLVLTSPPYALHFKKEYGNADQKEYVDWFLPFAEQIRRVLKPDGSFVLNVGGSWTPVRLFGPSTTSACCSRCAISWASSCARSSSGTIPPKCQRRPNG